MPRNVEIKARVDDLAALQAKVEALADSGPTAIAQDDTFFHCANGRLKLRSVSASDGELIFYQRADSAGPKTSFYRRTPTTDPQGLREALTLACGIAGRVVKRRLLFMIGRTRVHLDVVEGLGSFVELEVVLNDDEAAALGEAEAHGLLASLGIEASQLMSTAYVDLLRAIDTDHAHSGSNR